MGDSMNEICAASPFSGAIIEEEIYPTLPNEVKADIRNPLMYLFGKNSMPDMDNLLTSDKRCKVLMWIGAILKKWTQ